MEEEMIMIEIMRPNGHMFSVRSSVSSKVNNLKDKLVPHLFIRSQYQRLIYRGEIMKDDRTLDSYGLKSNHIIQLEYSFWKPPFAAGTKTTPPSNITTTGFQGPTGGMPDTSQLLSLMMQTLLSRPIIMDHIIGQNPQLQSMFKSIPHLRDIIQHPEVARRLTSRQAMQELMSSLFNQQTP